MPQILQIIIKILFVLFLTVINIVGVREAGKVNDILTILKIASILIFTIAGIIFFLIKPPLLVANFIPFLPLGWGGFGSTLVLIFWV